MPSVYIHLAGEDIDEAHCILNGTTRMEKEEEQLKPLLCQKCDGKNLPGSTFCNKCGAPLDLKTAIELDQARAKLDKLFNKLTEDPQKLDKLLNLLESA